jgi:hypothetical protein
LSVVNGRQRSYLSNYLDNHSGAMWNAWHAGLNVTRSYGAVNVKRDD